MDRYAAHQDVRPSFRMPQTSYPKDKIKILLLENISDAAVRELKGYGYSEIQKIDGALSED